MKSIAFVTVLVLAGCAAQPPQDFSWYHPQGGEHLFAYDHSECQERLALQGLVPGVNVEGPFFQCMRARGYQLLGGDPVAVLHTDTEPSGPSQVSLN